MDPNQPKVLMYVRPDGDEQKQELMVVQHCARVGLAAVSLCRSVEDCAALVRNGETKTVVVAYGPLADGLSDSIETAGGRVEYILPAPRRRLDVAALINRWYQTGRSVREIADLLDEPTGDVRIWLRDPRT